MRRPLPQTAPSPRSRTALAIAGVLMIGAALRFYGISRESLWLDEATSLMLARMKVVDLVEWTALDIHPPLYYLLLRLWLFFGESEIYLRSLSVVASILTIGVTYGLGRDLFGVRAGLLGAVILAVSPLHVWYAQEARMYAWVTLLMTLTLWAAVRVWTTRRWPWWAIYVVASVGALYTHYYGVFVIGVANLACIVLLVRHWRERAFRAQRLAIAWTIAQLAVFCLFLPWFPTFLLPITVGGGGWITMGLGRPTVGALAETAVLYMVGFGRAMYPVLLRRVGYLLITALTVYGAWPRMHPEELDDGRQKLNLTERLSLVIAYLALPLGLAWGASQVFKPMYSARYMLPFLVPFALLLGRGLASLPRGWWQVAALSCVLLGLVGIQAQVDVLEKPDWRGFASQLAGRQREGDVVLFMPGWHAKPFAYYADERISTYSDVPIPVPRYGDEALTAVEEGIKDADRVWFVWEDGHYTDPDGEVFGYLFRRCRLEEVAPLEHVGQVMLFDQCALGADSR